MRLLYILIALFFSSAAVAQENYCMYPDKDTGELERAGDCGTVENDLLTVDPSLLEKMMWSKYGMQCIYMNTPGGNGWYFINQNGLGRRSAFTHDNDCNGFRSGLAVGVSGGHVIYFNQIMDVVKTTNYTWASNFYKGYAKVCAGRLTKEYDKSEEHYQLKGGKCGFINRRFQVVIPVQYPYESTPTPAKHLP